MRLPFATTALAFAFAATGLSAQMTPFALFTPIQPMQNQLVFDNDGTPGHSIAATFDTANLSTGVDVNFAFNSNLLFSGPLAALNGPHQADFIVQSKTDDEAIRGPDSLSLQPIDSGVMEFLLETPVDGKDLLLKVTFSEAVIFASGSNGLELAIEPPLGGSTITYTSDFLDFNPLSPESWALALSNIDPCSSLGCDGALNDFRASVSGVFLGMATPASTIPEPKTYGLLAAWLSLAVVLLRRNPSRHAKGRPVAGTSPCS
jgi:hypothetical protein